MGIERQGTPDHKFQYNGKERQTELGLNMIDYGWRNYDAQLGRFHAIDPHADTYWDTSPYTFVLNNPLSYSDPTGMDTVSVHSNQNLNKGDVMVLDDGSTVTMSSGEATVVGQTSGEIDSKVPQDTDITKTEEWKRLSAKLTKDIERAGEPVLLTPGPLMDLVGPGVTKNAVKIATHLHHAWPKFLGGLNKGNLAKITTAAHKALHKDLNAFLKSLGMAPSRANPGAKIRGNFSKDQIQKALTDFYNGPGAKYKEAAEQFFEYIK